MKRGARTSSHQRSARTPPTNSYPASELTAKAAAATPDRALDSSPLAAGPAAHRGFLRDFLRLFL
uniref:Uncharacterized protein n=1 Tax=Arundo donax TaxID=35708 RepID=A0A0A9A0Z8_ARUDO